MTARARAAQSAARALPYDVTIQDGNGFGGALRALRRERRLSLQEVSTATGISASFLSLIENGKSDITLGRLMKLAGFYDVHVSDLLPPGVGRDPIVMRAEERRHIYSPSEGIDVFLLGPDSERRMLPLLVEFEPGGHPPSSCPMRARNSSTCSKARCGSSSKGTSRST